MLDEEGKKSHSTWCWNFYISTLAFYHQSKGAVWRSVLWNLLYTNSRNGSSLSTDTHTHSFFIQLRWLLSYRWIIVWTYKKRKKEKSLCHFWNLFVALCDTCRCRFPFADYFDIRQPCWATEGFQEVFFSPSAFQTFPGSQLESRCECQTFWRVIKREWLNAAAAAAAEYFHLRRRRRLWDAGVFVATLYFSVIWGELNCA